MPKEWHHTSCTYKSTKYYEESSISYAVQRYDLDLLYEIYINKIDKNEAKKKKNISFVKIKTNDRILGLKGLNTVTLNCIKFSNIIWYSRNKFISEKSKEYSIVKEYSERPSNDFENPNLTKLVKFLLKYKSNYAVRIANKSKSNKE